MGTAAKMPRVLWRSITMNPYDTFVAVAALIGITILGALGKVDSAVLTTVYGAVVGGAVGHARGYQQAQKENEQ